MKQRRLAIMQPYFFPYLGYFQLLAAADDFIVFDTPQFIRHGWVNRNRILSCGRSEWKYIRIPVPKSASRCPIRLVQIAQSKEHWQQVLLRNLDYYKQNQAPFYEPTIQFLQSVLQIDSQNLSEILVHLLRETTDYLRISLDSFNVFSKMELEPFPVEHAGHWALRICESVGADSYINLPGGRTIFDQSEFAASDINIQFLNSLPTTYHQHRSPFLSGLSIIDVLMWNSVEEVGKLLNRYELCD